MKTFMAFPVCSLVFITLVAIMYFSKPHIKSIENKIYKWLLIVNIIGLILEISCYFAVDFANDYWLLAMFILKAYVVYIFVWTMMFNTYVLVVTNRNFNKENDSLNVPLFKKIVNITTPIIIILSIVLASFPLYIYNENGLTYTYGIGTNLLVIICGIVSVIWLGCCLLNYKNIKQKRYIPIIACIVLLVIVAIIQSADRSILIATTGESFIVLLMYFTIENPDVKMIQQLNIARDQADKANKAKTEFLSNMSHEIRTPLNAIVGFSNILLEDEDVPEKSKDEIKDIVMASDNLLEIVNGILDISKIEANKIEIVNNEYSIKKVLDDLVALTKGRIAEKPLEFKVNIDETIPPVLYGDSQRIKQICVNILTNAVKYTKEGWIELKVSHIKIDNICRLIISVEDTGIGIKEGNIDKLFDKFERLDLNDNVTIEGTGLGLAITKKLVDLMGGKIVVQSVFGKGSRFTVSLDQRIVENPTIALDDIPETKNEEIKVEGKKVLIVDDNKINIKVAERLLDNYSVLHDSVESGLDCINKIKEGNKYDLILMDDMMPKMSGTEAFHELEKIPGFNVPVIALTANALTGMKEKYLGEGFSDYLAKPINKDELNRIINTFLNQE